MFLKRFNRRRKYRQVVAAELEHAKTLASKFVNQYDGLSYWIEKRKFIKQQQKQSDDSKLLDGRVYSVVHSKIVSVNVLLLRLLSHFDAVVEARKAEQKKKSKQTICDVCGTYQVKLSVCSRCKARKFCSVACQKKDWPKHKVCSGR